MARHSASLAEQHTLARYRSSFEKLLLLDDIWTGFLQGGRQLLEDEKAQLKPLVDEMRDLLSRCPEMAEFTLKMIRERVEFEEAAARMISTLTVFGKYEVLRTIEEAGGIASKVHSGLSDVVKYSADESEILTKKIRAILDGNFTRGDLTRSCAFKAAIIGMALASGPEGIAFAAYVLDESIKEGCWG
jgi:hypothetical protein